MVKKQNDEIDLDSILVEIGQFGWFQTYTIFLLLFPIIFSALAGQEYIFTAGDLKYRCHIPECEGDRTQAQYETNWTSNAIPGNKRCERYAPIDGIAPDETCPADLFDNSREVECDEYVYENTNTIVYDFDINCEDWKRTLVGTLKSVGTLIVLPFTGYLSDRFGRRTALIANTINTAIVGLIRSWSNSYEMYLVLILIEPSIGAGAYSSAFMLATEVLGPKYRPMAGVIGSSGFALGQTLLGFLAWVFPAWRTLLRVVYSTHFIIILYFWIISESMRWLIVKGKYKEAEQIIKRAAKMNGKQLSEKSLESLRLSVDSIDNISDEKSKEKQPSLFLQVVRSKAIFKRICIAPVWWITTTLVYYGLSLNAVGLSGNMYVNFILVSIIEIPGYTLAFFSLNFFGRKPTICVAFIMCAIANFAFAFMPTDLTWLRLLIYLLGKFFISMVFASIYVYTAELFPTNSRHTLLAFSSMIGRIGSISAPQTPLLVDIWEPFPNTIFGVMATLSGVLVLFTPETKGTKLPDTIEEAENI